MKTQEIISSNVLSQFISFICSPSCTQVAFQIYCDITHVYICKEIIYKSVTRDLAQSLERPLSGTQVSDTYIAFHRFDIFPALIKT